MVSIDLEKPEKCLNIDLPISVQGLHMPVNTHPFLRVSNTLDNICPSCRLLFTLATHLLTVSLPKGQHYTCQHMNPPTGSAPHLLTCVSPTGSTRLLPTCVPSTGSAPYLHTSVPPTGFSPHLPHTC